MVFKELLKTITTFFINPFTVFKKGVILLATINTCMIKANGIQGYLKQERGQ